MKEIVGNCQSCGKEILCIDGFLNGVVKEDKTMQCFECEEQSNKPNS
ncbi:hypothetical protein [Salibacterium aidingense]|nr:hypothetical protein [Salibacterium aidingense]